MSVHRWRWTDRCECQLCIGDCDLCDMEDEDEESGGAHSVYDRAGSGDQVASGQA